MSRIFQQCAEGAAGGFCTVSGTWFVDLDAMEAAHPGTFVNVPLSVSLNSRIGRAGRSVREADAHGDAGEEVARG